MWPSTEDVRKRREREGETNREIDRWIDREKVLLAEHGKDSY